MNLSHAWKKEEIELLKKLRKEGKQNAEIAFEMRRAGYNRSVEAVKNQVRKSARNGGAVRLRRINYSETRDRNNLPQYIQLDLYNNTNIVDAIKQCISNLPPISKIKVRPPTGKVQTLCAILGDPHVGKKTKLNGKEVYNINVFRERFKKFKQNFFDIYHKHVRLSEKIDEFVIGMIGDMLDGEFIYGTQHAHTDANVAKQLLYASEEFWDFIAQVAVIDPNIPVRVVCCRGNHGRTSKDADEESNWDLALYYMLELIAKKNKVKNLIFEISENDFTSFNVKGWNFFMGHQMPKDDDTAIARAKWGGWYEMDSFDAIITGHWHNISLGNWNGKPIFRNGCLSGTDDLSVRMSKESEPMQWVFGVNEYRKVSFLYMVDCKE